MAETCGTGMAAHAGLPAAMAEVMVATADILDDHARWVAQSQDEHAAAEALLWARIAAQHRSVAGLSAALAWDMRSAADLPDAPHDFSKMDPAVRDLMQRYVTVARSLASLLTQDADMMEAML